MGAIIIELIILSCSVNFVTYVYSDAHFASIERSTLSGCRSKVLWNLDTGCRNQIMSYPAILAGVSSGLSIQMPVITVDGSFKSV